MALKRINFTRNWNNKLDNHIFTTIRHSNYNICTNDQAEVYVNDVFKKQVICLHTEIINYEELNWVTLALDTGYLLAGANTIFEKLGITPGKPVKVLVLKTL